MIPRGWPRLEKAIPVHFIETQRLLDVRRDVAYRGEKRTRIAKVNACSEDFGHRLQVTLAQYATVSQILERSFPARVISGN